MSDSAEPAAPTTRRPPPPRRRGRAVAAVVAAIIVGLALAAGAAAVFGDKDTAQPFGEGVKEGDEVSSIGPVRGASIDRYAKARAEALAKATGERLALVSLSRYTTDGEARSTVANTGVVTVLAAPPGGAPSAVDGDLRRWADQQKANARTEREGFEGMLKDTDDPDSREHFQAEVKRLTALIDRVTPGGPIVFGVVVKAPVDRLRQISKAPGVRLVDVATSEKVAKKVEYRGLRPEETSKAGEPEFRPL